MRRKGFKYLLKEAVVVSENRNCNCFFFLLLYFEKELTGKFM